MKPIDAYNDTANRARLFLEYHDGLMNTRSRAIRSDWKAAFLKLMHWPTTATIQRVDSKDAVIILRSGATLTPDHFSQDWLDDQLRAALTFGVSALDRYVHERVIKGIIPALKSGSLTRQQEEFSIPVSTAIEMSELAVAASKKGEKLRPANIVRKKVQELLHKRPFQSYREIEYAFGLLGIRNLAQQLQTAYGTGDIKGIKKQIGHIAMRRNQIVHEGDLVVHERGGGIKWHKIDRKYVADSLDFLDTFVQHLETVT
ncbi:Uncharacterised protein [Burkholderia pseudomallei]|uniref:hypothetical protein n=2 Tax=Burkholderia pseudomallei TaxID=28450 RepID=UPI000F0EF3B2|nr:hypothetical protein [Burkholderia pseudomallei]CAJ2863482.1 Uncharacterised protein [Burkholderia pseudomallei]CAJ4520817.1 Uncharacterised protein [Burkholderia pseudomallei]CAJ8236096.1 Uncharacterised protein [Burkholderia pseudomallei]CAJ8256256.1 Uncharacterised protein [Burkholderia pseudomallei]CAJ8451542.1 Uncharacterised protein [Burkholderia pseudomallei]